MDLFIKSNFVNDQRTANRVDGPGTFADLVLLDGNPCIDLSNLWKVSLVMKEGHIYNPDSLRSNIKHSVKIGNYC